MMLACAGVIGASIAASFFVVELYDGVADLGRIQFSGDLLDTETDSSEPVNFLIIGVDSASGLDPDDPAAFGREVDARGNSLADTIAMLRIDQIGNRLRNGDPMEHAGAFIGQGKKIDSALGELRTLLQQAGCIFSDEAIHQGVNVTSINSAKH